MNFQPATLQKWIFIKPNKYAGKALYTNGGYIDFSIKDFNKNRLTADFWFMTPEKDFTFLNAYNIRMKQYPRFL
jgi:hypothetical protein